MIKVEICLMLSYLFQLTKFIENMKTIVYPCPTRFQTAKFNVKIRKICLSLLPTSFQRNPSVIYMINGTKNPINQMLSSVLWDFQFWYI